MSEENFVTRRRWPIFLSLLVLIGVTAVVPLVLSGAFSISRNRVVIEDEVRKYLVRSAESIAREADHFVTSYRDQVRKIADSMLVASTLAEGRDPFVHVGQTDLIETYQGDDPAIVVLRVLNTEGSGSRLEAAGLSQDFLALLASEAEAAVEGRLPIRRATVSGPHFLQIGSIDVAVLLFTMPVEGASGDPIGVVQLAVSAEELMQNLERDRSRGYAASIIDREGRLVLHPSRSRAAEKEALPRENLVRAFLDSNLAQTLTRAYETRSGRLIGTLAPARVEVPVEKQLEFERGMLDVPPAPVPMWGVLIERPASTAFAVIDEVVRNTVLLGLLALVLAVAGATVFARLLARPIKQLAEKSREIAAGNYGQRVDIRSRNEVGELAENFNHMSEELEKRMEQLKDAARRNHELFLNSIRTLAAAIDAKDPYTRGHSERVCRYSIIIARNMELPREAVAKIRISALLHDVGKIGIDDRILRKPAALTDDEFEIMKQHPAKGAAIMESIPELADVIPGMKYHHEKWEGGGYPDGLKGEEIPMQARIVAVADTFDAMTTTRPYQKAMELSYVITKIKSFGGTRFDPQVVEGLVRAFDKGEISLEDSARSVA